MTGRVTKQHVDFGTLAPTVAAEYLEEILRLDAQIFEYCDGATRSRYYRAAHASAERRVAFLYRDGARLVGYNLVTLNPMAAAGRRWSVVTSNAGFHPDYVGRNRTLPDAFGLMVRWMLREPWRRWTFVSFIVSPAAYELLVDVNPSIAPSVTRALDSAERSLLRAVAERAGHRIARDEAEGLTILLRRPVTEFRPRARSPQLDFYERRCAGHRGGEALGICASITPAAVASGLMRHLRRAWRRHHRALVPGAAQAFLGPSKGFEAPGAR